jgi:hypothetical protein
MKPKTKVHFEVLKLANKLPKVTKEQSAWAFRKLFKFYAYKTKHTTVCFECGHAWKIESNLISSIFGLTCPSCKKELVLCQHHGWSIDEKDYFQIMTTINDFQVIRMFQVSHYCKKGYEAYYGCHEIYQHWISPAGKLVILAIRVNAMMFNYTGHAG